MEAEAGDPATAPFRILVVCLGNVCRSPLAERLLTARLREAGVADQFEVTSAGLIGMVGHAMDPEAAEQLRLLGGDPLGFAARRVEAALAEESDLVLTATADIKRRLLQEIPSALRRTLTLREFALLADGVDTSSVTDPAGLVSAAVRRRATLPVQDLDIPDPMGGSADVHATSASASASAVDTIVRALIMVTRTPQNEGASS